MSDLCLVCLDFDGTIMVYDEPPGFFHPAAIAVLNRLEGLGIAWCTNSGRDASSQAQILALSRTRGLTHMPKALLCSESLIFERSGHRYVPSEPWNTRALNLLRAFHGQVQERVTSRLDEWRRRYEPQVYIGEEYTTFCVEDSKDRPARLFGELTEAIRGIPHGMVTRNGGWLAIMPDQLGKGNVLRGYLDATGTFPSRSLAIGDHFNDVSMLDGSAAKCVGCPADAVADVVRVVREAGGHVACAKGPEGTVEVIERFLSDDR